MHSVMITDKPLASEPIPVDPPPVPGPIPSPQPMPDPPPVDPDPILDPPPVSLTVAGWLYVSLVYPITMRLVPTLLEKTYNCGNSSTDRLPARFFESKNDDTRRHQKRDT